MTIFKTLVNNLQTTLGANYTAGSGTMTLATGTGALFGTVSSSAPVRFTVITAGSYGTAAEVLTIYQASGLSGDILSSVSAIEGTTDRNYSAGDKVEARPTQGSYADIHSAINAIETDKTILRTGSTSHATPYLLGDDGSFHQVTGSGVSYSGGVYTFPGGGSGSPAGANSQIQFNNAGAFAGAANWSIGAAGQLNAGSMAAPGSPSNGDTWWDSTRKALAHCVSGVTAFVGGSLVWITAPGQSVTGTQSETSLLAGAGISGTLALPANFFVQNRGLEFHFWGTYSTASNSGCNQMKFKLGAAPILQTYQGTFQNGVNGQAWECRGTIYCKSTGTSGAFNGAGTRTSYQNAPSDYACTLGTPTPGTDVTLDTTHSQTIDFTITLGNTGNVCQLTGGRITLLA